MPQKLPWHSWLGLGRDLKEAADAFHPECGSGEKKVQSLADSGSTVYGLAGGLPGLVFDISYKATRFRDKASGGRISNAGADAMMNVFGEVPG